MRVESPQLLLGYAAAVHEQTKEFLSGLSDDDLDRIVDRRWDPPVTLGVRLVSVLSDDLQHVGQAAYLRGLLHLGPSPYGAISVIIAVPAGTVSAGIASGATNSRTPSTSSSAVVP